MDTNPFAERSSAFLQCREILLVGDNDTSNGESYYDMMECLSYQRAKVTSELTRSLFLIICAALVFFMQAGFAMVCAGAVQKKNVQNTMLKNLLDACGSALAFFAIGYAFAFGGWDYSYAYPGSENESTSTTFIGTTNFFLMDVKDFPFWLFQYALSATATTIVAGTLAERCQMSAYLCYSLLLTGWVYPVVAHAVWSPEGFLSATSHEPLWGVGMIDFSGSGVVHCVGGFTALFATKILGPRVGRFDDNGHPREYPRQFPGHSMALQMLGTFTLWFGWFGFNCGSALIRTTDDSFSVAALAGVNTTLGAGAGGVTALFLNLYYHYRLDGEPIFDLRFEMNGVLAGLVSITAACAVIEPWAAVVIGFFGGIILFVGSKGLLYFRIDDVVDAIPVHFFSGVWGIISVGFFASPTRLQDAYENKAHPGLFYEPDGTLLGVQLVGLLFILGWVFFNMFPFFVWLDWRGWLRSDALEEIVGLDTSYHGANFLIGDSDGDKVNSEAIKEYKQRRAERLQRFGSDGDAMADSEEAKEEDEQTQVTPSDQASR